MLPMVFVGHVASFDDRKYSLQELAREGLITFQPGAPPTKQLRDLLYSARGRAKEELSPRSGAADVSEIFACEVYFAAATGRDIGPGSGQRFENKNSGGTPQCDIIGWAP
jgi:hypothetical protein